MCFNMAGIITIFITILASSIILSSAHKSCSRKGMNQKNLQKLALANNELAFNLLRKLSATNSANVFFSPFSISSAFGMLFEGARGHTEEELGNVLGYKNADLSNGLVGITFYRFLSEVLKSGNPNDGYVLNSANAILLDKDFDIYSDYKNDVEELFEASLQEVDFSKDGPEIVNDINSWVKEKTNGKIDKLLNKLSPSTLMVLLNAVYFKGTWKTKFSKENTKQEEFFNYGLESEPKEVPMMHMTGRFPYASMGDFQALELPYEGDNVTMYVLLPNEMDGLAALKNNMTPEKLSEIQGNMRNIKVIITLPKLKLEFSKELSPYFKALGAKDIFNAGQADFSGMTPSRKLSVSQVIHKAVVEVNEEGSEAAAVTGIIVTRTAAVSPMKTPEFTVDHPFLFAIVEKGTKSNMILFLGCVNSL